MTLANTATDGKHGAILCDNVFTAWSGISNCSPKVHVAH